MKTVLATLAGFIMGAVVLAAVAGLSADQFMIQQTVSPLSFEDTVESIKTTVTDKGWSLPKIHRLDESMKKHGYQVNKVAVLELCHPDHAYKILRKDDSLMVTPFMPCRISVYQRDDGAVVIARMNSGLMSNLFHREIAEVMGIATSQVESIIASATTPQPTIALADRCPE